MAKNDIAGIIATLAAVLTLSATLFSQFIIEPEKVTFPSILFMGIIIFVFIVYVVYSYFRNLATKTEENSQAILEMKQKIEYMREIHNLDKRLEMLERQDKRRLKGQIDPRLVIAGILVILFLLYLRSLGLLKF